MSDLAEKVVLVTGGTRGIGFELVKAFAAVGAAVTFSGASANSVAVATKRLRQAGDPFDVCRGFVADFADPNAPSAAGRGGRRGIRRRRRAGLQCRRHRYSRSLGAPARGMGSHPGRQPAGSILLRPGGRGIDVDAGRRQHRQHRIGRRSDRWRSDGTGLCRGEGRHDRSHQVAFPALRESPRAGQLRRAGRHRD